MKDNEIYGKCKLSIVQIDKISKSSLIKCMIY